MPIRGNEISDLGNLPQNRRPCCCLWSRLRWSCSCKQPGPSSTAATGSHLAAKLLVDRLNFRAGRLADEEIVRLNRAVWVFLDSAVPSSGEQLRVLRG